MGKCEHSSTRGQASLELFTVPHRLQRVREVAMEIACEQAVGAELELEGDENTTTQLPHDTFRTVIPRHYDLPEYSSEDEDDVSGQALCERLSDYVCCVCGKSFAFLDGLIQHFTVHTAEVRCHLCQVTFSRVISLALHLEYAHSSYHLLCKLCRVTCRSVWHMNEHLEKHNIRHIELAQARKTVASLLKQKYLKEQDVQEVIIEKEEVEIKYLKEEEDSVVGMMEETDRSSTSLFTEKGETLQNSLADHTYSCTHNLPQSKVVSEQATHSRCKTIWKTTKNVANASLGTRHVRKANRSKLKKGQKKVADLHSLQSSNQTSANHAVLEKTYTPKSANEIENKTANPISYVDVLEPAQFEVSIKTERDSEDTALECDGGNKESPFEIQEVIIKEEYEESILNNPQEDGASGSVPGNSSNVSKKVSNSDADKVSANYNSNASQNNFQRLHLKSKRWKAQRARKQQTLVNTNQKSLDPVKVTAAPEPSSSKEPEICSTCGLIKSPSMEKAKGHCKCTLSCTCVLCEVVCETEELLLKHQAEKHPLTVRICASCFKMYSNTDAFKKHVCFSMSDVHPGQSRTPDQAVDSAKSQSPVNLTFLPSTALAKSSKQPQYVGSSSSQTMPTSTLLVYNNVFSIPNTVQKITAPPTSTLNLLSNNVTSIKNVKDPLIPLSAVTLTKTAFKPTQKLVLTPIPTKMVAHTSPTAKMMPAKIVQDVVLHQQLPVLTTGPVHVPVRTSSSSNLLNPSAASTPTTSHQSKVTLRITAYPPPATKVAVSFSPAPVHFSAPTPVVATNSKSQILTGHHAPNTVRFPNPIHSPTYVTACTPTHSAAPVQPTIPVPVSLERHTASQALPPAQEPLKIVAMFVNQSQELALQKRLLQGWRSKAIFPCRQCGAISRQPSLGVRHRYQHRGPRPHTCQCGRTFQQRLHLLRHQVKHAEAVRYVCASCGGTFKGTHLLTHHKTSVHCRIEPSGVRNHVKKECRNVFHCNCGQVFVRPAALLWHMLKNSDRSSRRLPKNYSFTQGTLKVKRQARKGH